jgi:hypothetical protein
MREKKCSNQVEVLQAELEVACHALAQARRAFAEAKAEGADTVKEASAMRLAGDQVKELEVALAHAKEKYEAAQGEEERLKQLVKVETEVQALVNLKSVAVKVDDHFAELESLVKNQLGPAFEAAFAAAGGGIHQNALTVSKLEFERFLLGAASSFIGKGVLLDRLMKYTKFSESVPNPESARTRKRT